MDDENHDLTFYPNRNALLAALQSNAPNAVLSSLNTATRTIELREYLRARYSHHHSMVLKGSATDVQAHALLLTSGASMCAWLLHEGPAGFAVLREDVLTQAVDCRADSQVGRMVLMSALSVLVGSVKVRSPLFRHLARTTMGVPSKLPFFTRAAARAAQNTHATSAEWHAFLHSAFYTESLCRTAAGGFMRILFDALIGCRDTPGPNEVAVMDIVARFFRKDAPDCASYMAVTPSSEKKDITLLSEAMSAGASHVATAILHAILGSDRWSIPSLGGIAAVRAADVSLSQVESNYLYATLLTAPTWRSVMAISRGSVVRDSDRQLLNRFMRIAALPSVEAMGACALASWVEGMICTTNASSLLRGSTTRCAQAVLAEMTHDDLRRVLCPPNCEPLVVRALCAGLLSLVQLLLDYMSQDELQVPSLAGPHIGELLFCHIMAYARMDNQPAMRVCSVIWKGLMRRCPLLAMDSLHTLYALTMLDSSDASACPAELCVDLIDSAQHAMLSCL